MGDGIKRGKYIMPMLPPFNEMPFSVNESENGKPNIGGLYGETIVPQDGDYNLPSSSSQSGHDIQKNQN